MTRGVLLAWPQSFYRHRLSANWTKKSNSKKLLTMLIGTIEHVYVRKNVSISSFSVSRFNEKPFLLSADQEKHKSVHTCVRN